MFFIIEKVVDFAQGIEQEMSYRIQFNFYQCKMDQYNSLKLSNCPQ